MADNSKLKKYGLTDAEMEKITGGRTITLMGKTYQGEYLRTDEYCSRFVCRESGMGLDSYNRMHGQALCSECKYAEDLTAGEYPGLLYNCKLGIPISEVTNVWGERYKGDCTI